MPHGEEAHLRRLEPWTHIVPRILRDAAKPPLLRMKETRIQTMFEKGLLAGKRILVTGGGSGLGAAMGRRFVELGAELIICGRRIELLEATATKMRGELGGKVGAAQCDIRDGAAVDAMMDAVWREAPLDILINNAAATFIA